MNTRLSGGRGTSRVAIALAITLGTTLTMGSLPSSASPLPVVMESGGPSATDSDGDGVREAATPAAAVDAAASLKAPVEDLSQRTEDSSVLANPDGTSTLSQYAAPVRVKQHGKWVAVDPTLEKRADGSYVPRASAVDIEVAGAVGEAARVTTDAGDTMAFTLPTDLPQPTVKGGVATYKLSDSTDLLVSVTATGVTARYRVNERPASDDVAYKLGLETEGVGVDQKADGSLVIADDRDKTVATTSQLRAWDAQTDSAGEPTNVVDLDADLRTSDGTGDAQSHTLELRTPEGFLSDPDTVYPVTIDPDIHAMPKVRDTWVRNGDTSANYADNRLIVGKIAGSTGDPTRSFLKFSDTTLQQKVDAGAVINSAQLRLWQYYTYDCNGDYSMNVNQVGEDWKTSIGWGDQPSVWGTTNLVQVKKNGSNVCPDHTWTTANVTNMVKSWTSTSTNYGMRLSALDETKSAYERRFCAMEWDAGSNVCQSSGVVPVLNVNYNSRPSAAPAEAFVTTDGLKVSSRVLDADGDQVKATFRLEDAWTGEQVEASSSLVASGSDAVTVFEDLPEGNWTLTAVAQDASGLAAREVSTARGIQWSAGEVHILASPVSLLDSVIVQPGQTLEVPVTGLGEDVPVSESEAAPGISEVGLSARATGGTDGQIRVFNQNMESDSVEIAWKSSGGSSSSVIGVSENQSVVVENLGAQSATVSLSAHGWIASIPDPQELAEEDEEDAEDAEDAELPSDSQPEPLTVDATIPNDPDQPSVGVLGHEGGGYANQSRTISFNGYKARTWRACSRRGGEETKDVISWGRTAYKNPEGYRMVGGLATLNCGDKKNGFLHLLERGRDRQFGYFAGNRNWQEFADWVGKWVLHDPKHVSWNHESNSYCYERPFWFKYGNSDPYQKSFMIWVGKTGRKVLTMHPDRSHTGCLNPNKPLTILEKDWVRK